MQKSLPTANVRHWGFFVLLLLSIFACFVLVVFLVVAWLARVAARRLPAWVGWLAVAVSSVFWLAIVLSLLLNIFWVPTLPSQPPLEFREAHCYLPSDKIQWVECGPEVAFGQLLARLANLLFGILLWLWMGAMPLALSDIPSALFAVWLVPTFAGGLVLATMPYALWRRLLRSRRQND